MIAGKRVLALIPARGGSKGVPGKNIRLLAGKPLIAWTILAAQASGYIDRIVLSSDDDAIIEIAERYGCEVPFKRPAALAEDDTPGIAPALHALERIGGFDYLILLQPTSPLRLGSDIDVCLEHCHEQGFPACVSVTKQTKSPYWMYFRCKNTRLESFLKKDVFQRQDSPELYVLNGAVYIARCDWLKESQSFLGEQTGSCVMPTLRSLDIDSEDDFLMADSLMRRSTEQT